MKEDWVAVVGKIIKEEDGVVTREVVHQKIKEEEIHFDIFVKIKNKVVRQRVNIHAAEVASIKMFLKDNEWKDLNKVYRPEIIEQLPGEMQKAQDKKDEILAKMAANNGGGRGGLKP